MKLSYEKLNILYEVTKIINSTLNLKDLLKIIIDLACRIISAEAASIMLIDKKEKCLYFEVVEGEKEEQLKKIKVPLGQGIAGWVAEKGESLLIPDVTKDARFYHRVDEETKFITKSILCVPLKTKDKIIGVIEVLNSIGKESFDDEDIELLSALANQAAVAIENARLYEKLEEEKNYLNNILKSTPEAVIVLDLKGKIITFDEQARIYFKKKEEDVLEKFYKDIFDKDLSVIIKKLIDRTVKGEKVVDYEYEVELKNLKIIPLGLTLSILKNPEGSVLGMIIVCRDLTETRQVITLTELNKMKSEFVNIASHELRTPLTSIKGFVSTLISDTDGFLDEERKRRYYEIIDREADRLVRLVNDLLDSARIEAGKTLTINFSEFELREVIEKVVNNQRAYTKKHNFKILIPDSHVILTADADKIEQIMYNLLSNAVKYSPDGGEIIISAKKMSPPDLLSVFSDKIEDKTCRWIVVSIADEGLGILPEHLPKLFEKFQRIERKSQVAIRGTGIGLNLVKYLVELHSGKIWAESPYRMEEGVRPGSKFTFAIPENNL